MKTVTKLGEFAGKPMIYIYEEGKEEKAVVQFGLKKAEAILASVEEIKKFVEGKGRD